MSKLIIEFPNELAAEHFSGWLCESGELDYWEWMEYAEEKHYGDEPITAKTFNYPIKSNDDGDWVIGTECE